MQKIVPNLWFDGDAEEAARFYLSVFKDGKLLRKAHYGEAGPGPAGTVMTVEWRMAGMTFVGINGGPHFKFNPAVSFQIDCRTQREVDYYWDRLTRGGEVEMCGWIRDRFGLSWQIFPAELIDYITDPDPIVSQHVMRAMMRSRKLDVAPMKAAYKEGKALAKAAAETGAAAGKAPARKAARTITRKTAKTARTPAGKAGKARAAAGSSSRRRA